MGNIVDREKEHFDKLADDTGEIWWGSKTVAGIARYKRRIKIIENILQGNKDVKVLEVGCGTGAFTQHVLEAMPELNLTGCDVSPKALELCRKRFSKYPNAKFEEINAMDMSYEDNSFDVVIGNSVLHHFALQDSLKEIYRVLKPGGQIIFFEPNMMNPQVFLEKNVRFIGRYLQNSEDETAFFRWKLASQLVDTGFNNVRVIPFDFLHPGIPSFMIKVVSFVQFVLEKLPLFKEIGGSLIIRGGK